VKRNLLLVTALVLAGCGPVQQTSTTVTSAVLGPGQMTALPPLPAAQPTGVVRGRSVQNVMVDIASPPEADYGNEDNPLTGLKKRFYEALKAEGYSVYITNGSFANTPENMFSVLASDSALARRQLNTATVPDVILRVDWRENRQRSPLHTVTATVAGYSTTLELRACLWGPDGKLVWAGDIAQPIKRASIITGGSIRNQFSQPARHAGELAAASVCNAVKPLLPAPAL
jgi:hypothetical protein